MQAAEANPSATKALKLSASSWDDIMDAFPILALAFMAHFNILSVSVEYGIWQNNTGPTEQSLECKGFGVLRMSNG